jgi:hypothetical protein
LEEYSSPSQPSPKGELKVENHYEINLVTDYQHYKFSPSGGIKGGFYYEIKTKL